MAQYYHILDWRGLPLRLAATLASGLPEDSRCKLRRAGVRVPTDTLLLATLTDVAALLLWRYAEPGTPRPKSMAEVLTGAAPAEPQIQTFRSGADFDRALQRFIT